MPRSRYHEQLVQYAIAAGLMSPRSNISSRARAIQLPTRRDAERDEHRLLHTSTPRPLWLKARKSSFLITEPVGGFTPADLVFDISPPLETPSAGECRDPADARWEGGATVDISNFRHYNNPERFGRHLRRLHELVGTRKVVTAGEQYRNPSMTRQMGQMYISNLFGLYEVEEWSDENARKAQVHWTLWILEVLDADQWDKRLPRCPLEARKVLRHAIADVLSELEPKTKRRYQRMLEGTRLETGILQAAGLKTIARTCCIRKVTWDGEGAVFAEAKSEDLPMVGGEDVLERYETFLKRRRIDQAFDDAEVIASALRRRSTSWGRLRRHSGLGFPSLEMVFKVPSGLRYAPAQPSRLRLSIVLPSSVSSRGERNTAKSRKVKPYGTLAILRTWFGPEVAQAERRVPVRTAESVLSELSKLRAGVAAGGRLLQATSPETNTTALQSTSVPPNSKNQSVRGDPRGTKRPLPEVSPAAGSAQEEIKRVRRSSGLLSSSPSSGSAEEGIIAAQAENKRRGSGSLFGSSPSTGEPQNPRLNSQPEGVRPFPAQGAVQIVAPSQTEVPDQRQRVSVSQKQQRVMQAPQGLGGVEGQLRPPGRQYQPQTKYRQRLLGPHPPSTQQTPVSPRSIMRTQSSLQHPATIPSQVPHQYPLQGQPQQLARASNNPAPQQSAVPELAERAREDFWRRIPMVPDAPRILHEGSVAHGQAAWAEVNRHYQLIHQLLTSLPASRNATAQQIVEGSRARVNTQFRTAEARFKAIFPNLPLTQDQPLQRQIFALTWILSTVNPPRGEWADSQPYFIACCQLEARVWQLDLLRSWTQQWEQTLASARAGFTNHVV